MVVLLILEKSKINNREHLLTEVKRIRRIFNKTVTARNNTPFNFSINDEMLAARLGSLRKKEIELINQLSEL